LCVVRTPGGLTLSPFVLWIVLWCSDGKYAADDITQFAMAGPLPASSWRSPTNLLSSSLGDAIKKMVRPPTALTLPSFTPSPFLRPP